MSDDFKYQCRRRSTRRHPVTGTAIVREEQLLGAGSGGGPGDGNVAHYNDALFNVHSEEVFLHASSEQEGGGCISLLAEGVGCGSVNMHGREGVRITSGPPGQPPAYHEGIHGLEVAVGDEQTPGLRAVRFRCARGLATESSYNLSASGPTPHSQRR
jgi:hypothetical protein